MDIFVTPPAAAQNIAKGKAESWMSAKRAKNRLILMKIACPLKYKKKEIISIENNKLRFCSLTTSIPA